MPRTANRDKGNLFHELSLPFPRKICKSHHHSISTRSTSMMSPMRYESAQLVFWHIRALGEGSGPLHHPAWPTLGHSLFPRWAFQPLKNTPRKPSGRQLKNWAEKSGAIPAEVGRYSPRERMGWNSSQIICLPWPQWSRWIHGGTGNGSVLVRWSRGFIHSVTLGCSTLINMMIWFWDQEVEDQWGTEREIWMNR